MGPLGPGLPVFVPAAVAPFSRCTNRQCRTHEKVRIIIGHVYVKSNSKACELEKQTKIEAAKRDRFFFWDGELDLVFMSIWSSTGLLRPQLAEPDPTIYAPWSVLFGTGKRCDWCSQGTQAGHLSRLAVPSLGSGAISCFCCRG